MISIQEGGEAMKCPKCGSKDVKTIHHIEYSLLQVR